MKIVCIKEYKSQGLQLELTYGKSYEVVNSNTVGYFCIRNDRNQNEHYTRTDFVTLDEWRELQLKEIGLKNNG